MGFKITWDADKIISDLRAAASQANSSYNDGFSAWGCKKDLLKVKYALDDMLHNMPTFNYLEQQFIDEQEKNRVWKALETKI